MARAHNQAVFHGERNGNSKLTPDLVRAIRASNEQHKVIAWRFGISLSSVNDIRNGRAWRHVDEVSSAAQEPGGANNAPGGC
jgi:hypothetical protein